MYSKNIMARLFPALNDEEPPVNGSQQDYEIWKFKHEPPVADTDPRALGRQTPTLRDLAPVLSQFAQSNNNGGTLGETGGLPPGTRRMLGLVDGYDDQNPAATAPLGGQYAGQLPPSDKPLNLASLMGSAQPDNSNGYADDQREDTGPTDNVLLPDNAKFQRADAQMMPSGATGDVSDDDSFAATNPALSPREQKKAEIDALVNEKVVNKDKGIKGRIWEAVQNTIAGMGGVYAHNPRASWKEEVAGGAGGALGGSVNRAWNEERQHDSKLAKAQDEYKILSGNDETESKLADADTERQTRVYNALTARQKLTYDKLSAAHKEILDVYKEAEEFDPNATDTATKELKNKAALLNITLLPKKKGDRFTFMVDPTTGKLIIGNTGTGQFHVGQTGLPGKGTTITKADIPYSFFGLKDDKTIDDEVSKAIAPDFPNRRVRPEIASALANQTDDAGNHPYQAADGSFNEEKAIQDGVFDPATGYEAAGSDYEKRKAGARDKLRKGQSERQRLVDEFSSALMTHKPSADNPTPKSLHQVMSLFKDILDEKNAVTKKKALKMFYDETLPKIQIR